MHSQNMTRARCWAGALMAAAMLVAGAAEAEPVCRWPEPARDPFRGDAAEAVLRLDEIPDDERRMLAVMVRQRFGGRVVHVGRDHVDDGRLGRLRQMNFGAGRVCEGLVDRSMWPAGRNERAVAYVHGRWAVVVFVSCNNVALADNLEALPAPAEPSRALLEASRGPVVTLGPEGLSLVHSVPEPSSWALAGMAVMVAALARRVQR